MTPYKLLVGIVLTGAVVLAASQTLAADKESAPKTKDADPGMEAWMKAATPGPEHKRLAQLVGSWDGAIKMWMDPSKPPTESKGTVERKMILDGRFLYEEVKSQFMGMPFTGVGLTGYDNVQKKYLGTWVDSLSTGMSHSLGTADASGKVLTFHREHIDPMTGKKVKGTDIVRFESKDRTSMESFHTGPDGKDFKVMEITFTRKGKATSE